MQWLIDLIAEKVIAEIGVPPCYIDRGDDGSYDFTLANLTLDGPFHDLDVSGIVPEGATAVLFSFWGDSTDVPLSFVIQRKGGDAGGQEWRVTTQIAHVPVSHDGVVVCPDDRILEYRGTGFVWDFVGVRVKGWWL